MNIFEMVYAVFESLCFIFLLVIAKFMIVKTFPGGKLTIIYIKSVYFTDSKLDPAILLAPRMLVHVFINKIETNKARGTNFWVISFYGMMLKWHNYCKVTVMGAPKWSSECRCETPRMQVENI